MARERKYEVVDRTPFVEKILAKIDDKGFTPTQDHFGEWVTERAAPDFKTAKERDAFLLGAKYALALRMEHQMSPENEELKAQLSEARTAQAESVAEARAAKKAARQAPAEDETPAPRRGRKAAAAAEEAPAKPARRGRATKAAEPVADEAPATPRRGRPPRGAAAAKGEGNGTRRPAATTAARRPARRGANKAEAEF